MSTSFDVFPVTTKDVNFGDVFKLATENTHKYFSKYGIEKNVTFEAQNFKKIKFKYVRTVQKRSDLFAEDVWIQINGNNGGTSVGCWRIFDEDYPDDPWSFVSEITGGPNFDESMESALPKIKKLDRMWNFKRSAGNSALGNLCYGYLAAAVAQLTDGIIYSSDCAWEGNLFPFSSEKFLEFYFNPELASDPDMAEWANRCIEAMKEGK